MCAAWLPAWSTNRPHCEAQMQITRILPLIGIARHPAETCAPLTALLPQALCLNAARLQYQVYLGGDTLPDSLYNYPGNYLVLDNTTASLNSMLNFEMRACSGVQSFWCEVPLDFFPCYPVRLRLRRVWLAPSLNEQTAVASGAISNDVRAFAP
jgi:hypothetical protein